MNKQCKFCIHSDVCAYKEHYKDAVELYEKVKYECGKYPYFVCDIRCSKYCMTKRDTLETEGMTIGGALSDLNNLFNADDIPFYYKPSIKAVMDTIELSSSENPNRWIPVSEELPEDGKDVMTCGNGGFIEIQSLENPYDAYWENQNGDWTDLEEITAWMPLPEPYRAERSGEE